MVQHDSSIPESGWVQALRQRLKDNHHRAVLVLSGDRGFCYTSARKLLAQANCEPVLWVSSQLRDALAPNKARTQLGQEYDGIVFDVFDQFDVDAFAAISGTLRGGGLLCLLMPEPEVWSSFSDSRFVQRAWPLLSKHPTVFYLHQGEACRCQLPELVKSTSVSQIDPPFRTAEQQQVVDAITRMVVDQSPAAAVLISDRGRGKTSALGLAAGHLLKAGLKNIIVTAPRLSVTAPMFEQAQRVLPEATIARGELSVLTGHLQFMAPDALLEIQPPAELLLVDEAAAIPLTLLNALLQVYPNVIFATTVHGYEGTGRGFVLKFNQVLDRDSPGWQLFNMQTPVRWADDDPVEQWVDRLLCLDAELPEVPEEAIEPGLCQICAVDRDALVNDEARLSSLFALLVYAHYRTRPSDLKYMLDDHQVRIYTLEYQQQILAAVLLNEEGGFDAELSSAIYRGERRPNGHMLAQTLSLHAGCETAATLKYARVMRIAVHPALQGQGLGTHLLQAVVEQERQRGLDAIGTSFGATAELLRFWQAADFAVVRLGFSRDHASGTHSAVMLKAFTPAGQNMFVDVRNRFRHALNIWLQEPLATLAEDIKEMLVAEAQSDIVTLTAADWQDIESFAYTHRGYEACMWSLHKLLEQHHSMLAKLDVREQQIIDAKIRRGLSWSETVGLIAATGKAEAIVSLRQAVARWLEVCVRL